MPLIGVLSQGPDEMYLPRSEADHVLFTVSAVVTTTVSRYQVFKAAMRRWSSRVVSLLFHLMILV